VAAAPRGGRAGQAGRRHRGPPHPLDPGARQRPRRALGDPPRDAGRPARRRRGGLGVSAPPRTGLPIVVSAPSGTGKTTVCRALVARDPRVVFSISHTTRAPRTGEKDGVDCRFVAEGEFEALVEKGAFLEHARYSGHRYGTSWAAIEAPLARGPDVLLEIETQGAR